MNNSTLQVHDHRKLLGHYKETCKTLELMMNDIKQQGYRIRGHRHEIYLNKPLYHATPDAWQTIVRLPIEES